MRLHNIGRNGYEKTSIYLDNIAAKYSDLWLEKKIQPKISVIVPIYNVEDYLEDCLSSLLNQTFKEFEVLMINDGSTDLSTEIANEFSKNDLRFKLINQENKGQSSARNNGIKNAIAPYICFIDSDDWVDNNFLEKHYETITTTNSDITASSIIRWRKNNQKYRINYTEIKSFNTLEDKIKICDIPRCCYVWNKLYKTELVKNNLFEQDKYFEDVLWIPEIIKKSNKLTVISDVNYYYRARSGSTVKKKSTKKQFDSYCAKKYLINFFDENNLTLTKKQRIITKDIKYLFNIPILKIKEYNNDLKFYLFSILPILTLKNHSFNFLNLIRYKDIDNHHLFNIFGLIIRKSYEKFYVEKRIPNEYVINTTENRDEKIIVSLTTFPDRINKVYLTINQLLTQSLKPDRLILYLADSQFKNKEKDLPQNLLNLKQYGLEIKWCEDLRSYKKLIPALIEFKNDIIITYDDDIYYSKNSIEKLYNAYLKDKNCICTHRNSKVYFKNDKLNIFKAKQTFFDISAKLKPSLFNTIIGCGGVLYPPNSLFKDVLDIDKFKNIVPTQDDIWFWTMAVLNKTKIKVVDGFDTNLYTIEDTQNCGLCKENSSNNKGMSGKVALENVLKIYPEIIDILKEDINA